jgi:malonyl-CoA decarboxylase
VLGFLITHDRVKPMHGWRDLHRRLRRDRRCFGLFHPALPDEPVAFAEIALTSGLPADVQALVDPDAPVLSPGPRPSVVFYSISSCHEGLRGVRFGNALIRRAIDDLAREFPRTRTVATLSPVPGFRDWLTRIAGDGHGQSGVAPLLAELDDACWRDDPARSAALGRVLVPLCAFYLLRVKRGVEPADPVARFHLGNGARLERINWPGDQSDIGMRGSAGLTVNYVYRLAEIERNHQACATGGEVLASTRIHSLARQAAAGS